MKYQDLKNLERIFEKVGDPPDDICNMLKKVFGNPNSRKGQKDRADDVRARFIARYPEWTEYLNGCKIGSGTQGDGPGTGQQGDGDNVSQVFRGGGQNQ